MDENQARELLDRYQAGLCTEQEKIAVERWLSHLEKTGRWHWKDEDKQAFGDAVKARIEESLNGPDTIQVVSAHRVTFFRLAAACLFLLMAAGGVYFFFSEKASSKKIVTSQISVADDSAIQPGQSGAILTLSNGQQIILDTAADGTLATQSNVKIVNANGELSYNVAGNSGEEAVYNTVTTPRGRQFKLRLSDGSRVWLNAASSIRYPAKFSSEDRIVEVSGEAYFEIATVRTTGDKTKLPFHVKILSSTGKDAGMIEVTGTEFNVNAYEDEMLVKTTLIEGGILLKSATKSVKLIPGQQALLGQNGKLDILKNVNVSAEIAWKNGYFTYDKTDIQTVMKQLARWYDIEVEYEGGKASDEKYWGDIQRDAPLSDMLKVLEVSGVKFTVVGRKIIVNSMTAK